MDGAELRGFQGGGGRHEVLKELMTRIGHSSTRAAMIYQHATRDRDQAIAAALDALIVESRSKIEATSGTDLAREATSA